VSVLLPRHVGLRILNNYRKFTENKTKKTSVQQKNRKIKLFKQCTLVCKNLTLIEFFSALNVLLARWGVFSYTFELVT